MFGRLYLAELKKQARPKMMIIFGAIALAMIVITTLITVFVETNLNVILNDWTNNPDLVAGNIGLLEVSSDGDANFGNADDILDDYDLSSLFGGTVKYSKAECEYLLPHYQDELQEAIKEAKAHLYDYYSGFGASEKFGTGDYVYAARARYSVVKFIDDNGYYDKEFIVYGDALSYSNNLDSLTMEDILTTLASVLMTVSQVFAIVMGAYSITNEIKNGTIKLMLMRPVSREKFLGAKLLAGYTLVAGFQTIGYVISAIIAAVLRTPTDANIMFVFNSNNVYVGSGSLAMFYNYIFGMVAVTAYYALAFGLGTMIKNMAVAIVIPLVAGMGVLLFNAATIGRYWFTTVIDWTSFFGYGSNLVGGSHFAIAFLMTTAYMIMFVGGALLIFHKRDAA